MAQAKSLPGEEFTEAYAQLGMPPRDRGAGPHRRLVLRGAP